MKNLITQKEIGKPCVIGERPEIKPQKNTKTKRLVSAYLSERRRKGHRFNFVYLMRGISVVVRSRNKVSI